MLEPRASDFAVWLVALALYVFDAARLLSSNELLLVEAGGGRLDAVVSEHPFTLGGRVLAFPPLLLPHRAAFVASWGEAWHDPSTVTAALGALTALRRALRLPRLLAVWAFVVLFVGGPLLTVALGPDAAVVYIAGLVYPSALLTGVLVWRRRRAWSLTAGQAAMLALELIACPAFLPNLMRKVTGAHRVQIDGAQAVLAAGSPDDREVFVTRLGSRAEALINQAGDDAATAARLRSYLVAVRAAG